MTTQEFENLKTAKGIIGTGVETTTKRAMDWTKHAPTRHIPMGAKVHVWFSPQIKPYLVYVEYEGIVRPSISIKVNQRFRGFSPCPSMAELRVAMADGTCETLTGDIVEPDGYGPDGAPSWLLAMQMI